MPIEPSAEYERVQKKYAAVRPWELALFVIVAVIASFFRSKDWWITVVVVAGMAAGWEIIKWRLRRNARWFAESSQTG